MLPAEGTDFFDRLDHTLAIVVMADEASFFDRYVNPLFPASGLATGSLNGINPKSKFLALATQSTVRFIRWLRAHIYSEAPLGVSAARLAAVWGC